MINVNILEHVYGRLGKCYPEDEKVIENEKNFAKILNGDIVYDITNVQVENKTKISGIVNKYMLDRSEFCSNKKIPMNNTSSGDEIMKDLKKIYPEKKLEEFIQEVADGWVEWGGGKSKSKRSKSNKRKSKKRRKSNRRKSKKSKKKTRRKKR